MSKYGFNENELRKTIVTAIDKDGFHKKTLFEGKSESADKKMEAEIAFVDFLGLQNAALVINVPNNPDSGSSNPLARLYALTLIEDGEWVYDIGDTLDGPGLKTVYSPFVTSADLNAAAFAFDIGYGESKFIQIYATNDDDVVIDRVRLKAEAPESSS